MDFFLGVDAGGTRTRAVVADAAGSWRGAGSAGTGNWQAIGAGAAGAAIRAAVGQALGEAKIEGAAVRGSFFGLAGVRTDAERAVMRAELAPLGLGGNTGVGGDLEAAHAGALAGGPGVVVIAGTGSAAWGRNASGESWQAGGWGWLTDDKGGGYWLAVRGLAAVCEAADGRGLATALGERAEVFFETGLRELLRDLHAGRRDRAAVAGFAREVCATAEAGDPVAEVLLGEAANELVRLAEAVRARVWRTKEVDGIPLSVVGGLDLSGRVGRVALDRGFEPTKAWGAPVLGSVLRAAEIGGARLDVTAQSALLQAWKLRAD